MWLLVFQRIVVEFILDILYFPLWWYTGGAKHALLFGVDLIKDGNSHLAPGLWLKNIFVPMFGQYDWQGRLVSFFMRVVNIIGRSIGLLIWFLVVVMIFILWLIFPLVVGYMLVASLFGRVS
ncbi:MAG: hypothetical protein UY92_C0022G0002 [Candidatus Magasanikbacteria bacterium GW2011_GWA2_56_11]|uniref:Uncharacterized protein n=1 Tax=Candidatus Magasanikbacteria bacterium GW2011_GWA2_56_11 TaxID=1619044 RepID=A0A0G2AJE7_9BACT|nr:MAG: hypothetical protein UY92_C0022G0002 [Candidatus Magasanikbacteria bacterium GW2011_GWA2_56_11]